MTARTGAIIVDARLEAAYNSAPKTKQKKAISAFRRALRESNAADKQANGQAKKNVPHLSRKESELLARINQLPDMEKRRRIEELTDKMEYESITDEEHAELLRLCDEMESFSVDRLRAVIGLAKHRKVPPAELMKQLGLTPGKHAR